MAKPPMPLWHQKASAIEEASIIALRDAGAKLMLDFYRIPAVNNWVGRAREWKSHSTALQAQAAFGA